MMTGTRISRTVGALLLACVSLVPAGVAQAQTLDEIVEASLEATGGRDAMGRITSVRYTGTFTMITGYGDIDGDTEVVIIPSQKLYQDLNSDLFQQIGAWNGTSAWQSDNVQGMVGLEGQQAESLEYQTMLHPFLPYNTPALGQAEFSKLDDAEVGGRSHHVVAVSKGSLSYKFSVDAETKLVSRITFDTDIPQAVRVTITAEASGYEEHNGVLLAMLATVDIPGFVTIETRYTTVELNGEVDHSILEKP